MPTMTPRLRSVLLNVSLLIGSLTFVIGGLEFALRVTGIEKGRPVPPPIYQRSSNPDISYELKPSIREKAFRSTIITSEQGFRSSPIDPAKPTLALLGDSITFGYGVENSEMISAAIEAKLPDWNVVNTGVPGYNLRQERATYEQKLKGLGPRALVLIFHWNDLGDMTPAVLDHDGNLRDPRVPAEDRRCDPIRTGILNLIPGKCWLDQHSSLYRVIKKVVSARTERQNLAAQEQQFREDAFTEHVPVDRIQDYGRELESLVAQLPPDQPRLFVIWPEKELHFTLRPQLATVATIHGFKVLDLYDVFGNTPETLGWDTVHPSAATATTAGGIIADALRHYGMVK